MKLIIEIDETMIQELKDGCFGAKHKFGAYELAGCIMEGIPLEEHCEACIYYPTETEDD